MKPNILVFRQREDSVKKELRAILDKAAAENRGLNEAEAAAYEDKMKALKAAVADVDRETALLETERRTPVSSREEVEQNGNAKFSNFGEQLQAIRKAALSHGRVTDPRLVAGPAGSSEAVPSDGGFLVQKDFSQEILMRVYQTGSIQSRCRKVTVGAGKNGLRMNAIDEDSRADGSRWGGVQAYWLNEAGSVTSTKPKMREVELQLQKLMAVYYATDELLEDAEALGMIVSRAFGEEMAFKLEDAILNGVGQGQPLGILNSGALVTVAEEAAQVAETIVTNNILKMWERLWAPSRKNAAWFIDQSTEQQLYQLVLGAPSLGQILLYTPPSENGDGLARLMGRPVIPTEHNAQLGTVGDIVLADLDQYLLIDKGGVRQDYSMHVNFLTDEGVFRFVYRVDGQAWWKKPLTPKSDGPTQSPFVALATRS